MFIRSAPAAAVCLVMSITTLTGCRRDRAASDTKADPAPATAPALQLSTHELTKDEPYYLGGPMQGRPPEGTLEAGTRVVVLERMNGYSRVRTEGGVTAWIAHGGLKLSSVRR